jgi:hypothetical protein
MLERERLLVFVVLSAGSSKLLVLKGRSGCR